MDSSWARRGGRSARSRMNQPAQRKQAVPPVHYKHVAAAGQGRRLAHRMRQIADGQGSAVGGDNTQPRRRRGRGVCLQLPQKSPRDQRLYTPGLVGSPQIRLHTTPTGIKHAGKAGAWPSCLPDGPLARFHGRPRRESRSCNSAGIIATSRAGMLESGPRRSKAASSRDHQTITSSVLGGYAFRGARRGEFPHCHETSTLYSALTPTICR